MLLRQFSRVLNLRQRVASGLGLSVPSDVFRTKVNYRLTNRQITAAAGQHGDADLNLFLTFSFSSYTHSTIPVVHYCDRTYEHHLEDRGRIPTRRDRAFIQIERDIIENARLVLTTSEVCRDFIKSHYKTQRLMYLRAGLNVEAGEVDPDSLIAHKEGSRDILFIGRGAYKRGVVSAGSADASTRHPFLRLSGSECGTGARPLQPVTSVGAAICVSDATGAGRRSSS